MTIFLSYLKLYLSTLPLFLVLDGLWLGLIAKGFYAKYLSFLISPKINIFPAILFYLLYVVGIIVFAVKPAIEGGSLFKAAALGGLFGLICYATYDLTNQTTIKDWPLIVTIVDMLWGLISGLIVSLLSYIIAKKLSTF